MSERTSSVPASRSERAHSLSPCGLESGGRSGGLRFHAEVQPKNWNEKRIDQLNATRS